MVAENELSSSAIVAEIVGADSATIELLAGVRSYGGCQVDRVGPRVVGVDARAVAHVGRRGVQTERQVRRDRVCRQDRLGVVVDHPDRSAAVRILPVPDRVVDRGVGDRRSGNRDRPGLHASRVADPTPTVEFLVVTSPPEAGDGVENVAGPAAYADAASINRSSTAIADTANESLRDPARMLLMSAPLSAKVQPISTPLAAAARRGLRALHRIAGGPRASTGLRFRSTPKACVQSRT